eukprot:Phypoly_transcript_00076.p1 GENE.Phypoly_transcript_00076~~Phypoly_transcript_00076.p1  ORF type:complete len:2103 (+),score=395.41 Phypoly_transcript_00076:1053-7361(+)
MKWTGGTITATTSIYGNIDANSGDKTIDGCIVNIYATTSASNGNFKLANDGILSIRSASTFTSGGSISFSGNGSLENSGVMTGNFTAFSLDCLFLNYGQVFVNGSLLLLGDSTNWGQINLQDNSSIAFAHGTHYLISPSVVSGNGTISIYGDAQVTTNSSTTSAFILALSGETSFSVLSSLQLQFPTVQVSDQASLSSGDLLVGNLLWSGGSIVGSGALNISAALSLSGSATKSLIGKDLAILGSTQWTGGDMLLNSSSVSNYGALTISNLHQPLLDTNSVKNATFANYGNIKISASSVAVQVRTFHVGSLDISSDSTISFESDVSFQNGAKANVAGTLKVADGANLDGESLVSLSGTGTLEVDGAASFANGSSVTVDYVTIGDSTNPSLSLGSNASFSNLQMYGTTAVLTGAGVTVTSNLLWTSGLISSASLSVSSFFVIQAGQAQNATLSFERGSQGIAGNLSLTQSSIIIQDGATFKVGNVSGLSGSTMEVRGTVSVIGNYNILAVPILSFGNFVFAASSVSVVSSPLALSGSDALLFIQNGAKTTFTDIALADSSTASVVGRVTTGALRIDNSTLKGSGSLSIDASFSFTSGVISAAADITLGPSCAATFENSQEAKIIAATQLTNYGSFSIYGAVSFTDASRLLNKGNTFTNASIMGTLDSTFSNEGSWLISAVGNSFVSLPIWNSAAITISGDSISISNFSQSLGNTSLLATSVSFTQLLLQNGTFASSGTQIGFSGSSEWSGGDIQFDSSTSFNNSGDFAISVPDAIISSPLLNYGTVLLLPTTLSLTLSLLLSNNGAFQAPTSTLNLLGGFTQNDTHAMLRASSILSGSACALRAGTVELSGDASVFTDLFMEGGELTGSGNVNATNLFWSSGTISGASFFTSSTILVQTTAPKYLTDRTLVNQANLSMASSVLELLGASIINQAGASATINSSSISGDTQSTITNNGQTTTSGDDVIIQAPIRNFADFQQNGSSTINYFENAGTLSTFGKTEISAFNFTSGKLAADGNTTLGVFTWVSGSISGPSPISVVGDSMFLPSPDAKLANTSLSFYSSLTLSSTSLFLSAPLTLNTDATAYLYASAIRGSSTLVNHGTVVGSDGRSELSVSNLSASGALRVLPGATLAANGGGTVGGSVELYGTAEFDGSTYDFASGASITGNGTISWQNSSQISFYGGFAGSVSLLASASQVDIEVPISVSTLALGDAANLTTTRPMIAKNFAWYGASTLGNGSSSGNLTVSTSITISGSDTKYLNGSSIFNQGTAKWSGGDILLSQSASFYTLQSSVFTISSPSRRRAPNKLTMRTADGSVSTLQNVGAFTVAQDADILLPILNLGQLEVAKDCRFGFSSYTQRGNTSETQLDGGTLAGDTVTINGGTISGSGIIFAPFTNNGTFSVEGPFLIGGTFSQTKDAKLVLTIYGNSSLLAISGHATLGGILEIRWNLDPSSVTPGQPLQLISFSGGLSSIFAQTHGLESTATFDYPLVYTSTSLSVVPALVSSHPTTSATSIPTTTPTSTPSPIPTTSPGPTPTPSPSSSPTSGSTPKPTSGPTLSPTSGPTLSPTSSPTSAPTTGNQVPNQHKKDPIGMWVGIAVGAFVFLLIVLFLLIFAITRNKRRETPGEVHDETRGNPMKAELNSGEAVLLAGATPPEGASNTSKKGKRSAWKLWGKHKETPHEAHEGDLSTAESTDAAEPSATPRKGDIPKKGKRATLNWKLWGKSKNTAQLVPDSPSPAITVHKIRGMEEGLMGEEGDRKVEGSETTPTALPGGEKSGEAKESTGAEPNAESASTNGASAIVNGESASASASTREPGSSGGTEERAKGDGVTLAAVPAWTDPNAAPTISTLPPLVPLAPPATLFPPDPNANTKKETSPRSGRKPSPAKEKRSSLLGPLPPLMSAKNSADQKGKKAEISPRLGRKPSPAREAPSSRAQNSPKTPRKNSPAPSPKSKRRSSNPLPSPLQDSTASPQMEFNVHSLQDTQLPPVQKVKVPHKELGPLQKSKPQPVVTPSPQLGAFQKPPPQPTIQITEPPPEPTSQPKLPEPSPPEPSAELPPLVPPPIPQEPISTSSTHLPEPSQSEPPEPPHKQSEPPQEPNQP